MGASDLHPTHPRGAVEDCADDLGDSRRQFFTTADTVEDLEALRIALGADKLALDGISYGSYVAQRYALAHPQHVRALVLDSVVPAEGVSLLSEVSIKATRRVLGPETTAALAKVIRTEHNGVQLLDMLTSLSVGAPRDDGYLDAIRRAATGGTPPPAGCGWLRRVSRRTSSGFDTARDAQPGPAREHAVRGLRPRPGEMPGPIEERQEALRSRHREALRRRPVPRPRNRDRQRLSRASACTGLKCRCRSPPRRADLPDVPDAPAQRRPRPLDADGMGATGGEALAPRPPADGRGRRPWTWQEPDNPEALATVRRLVAHGPGERDRIRRADPHPPPPRKAFGPDPVQETVLRELFELARWAPNHHLTDPWRFRVLGPTARERLKPGRGRGQGRGRAPSSTARGR